MTFGGPTVSAEIAAAHPSEWQGRTELLSLVQESVDALDWPQRDRLFRLDEEQCFPAHRLMVLEIYCLARGRGATSSEEIERFVRYDLLLRSFFPDALPLSDTLVRFRKRHHQLIQRCLITVFDLAFKARFGDADSDAAPIDFCVAQAVDSWFEPVCGPQPEIEAETRIDTTAFVDAMSVTD
jgi:hypothetical protein